MTRLLVILACLGGAGPILIQPGGGAGGGISPPAGQIGGTAGSPTVLGIRETAGPTLLTFGAVADTQCLARSGTTVVGTTCGSGGTIAVQKGGSAVGTRGTINIIDGTNVTTTVADNAGSNRVDITIAASGGGGGGFQKHFAADMFIATDGSWPITTPAPAPATRLNLASYRTFDPTTAQGVGLEIPLASGVTGITVVLDSAPATSGFTTNNAARYGMACRQKGSSAAFTTQLATASVYADNTNIQRHTLSFTLVGLGLTAGTTALCNWHRAAADAGDTLTATVNALDWYVSAQ